MEFIWNDMKGIFEIKYTAQNDKINPWESQLLSIYMLNWLAQPGSEINIATERFPNLCLVIENHALLFPKII